MRIQPHRSAPIVCALLFVPVILVMAGCSTMSGYSANRIGTAYYRRGNYTAAAYEFRRAAIDDPHNADYAYNLAAAMKNQGDVVGAEQSYKNALMVNPTHQPSYHGLAVLLNEQKRTAEADQLIDGWAAAQPMSPAAHIELAWLKSERGDFATAEQSLQQALVLRPDHPVALAQLGQLYERTGQHDRATAMYQQSLQANWYQPRVESRLAAIQQPAQMGGMPAFAQNPAPMTAQGQPSPGYAQYQPYQSMPQIAENPLPDAVPGERQDTRIGADAISPPARRSDFAPPQIPMKNGVTGVIGGAPPTLIKEAAPTWTAPAAQNHASAKSPPDQELESAPFVEPAPTPPAEKPAADAGSAENADPAHTAQ